MSSTSVLPPNRSGRRSDWAKRMRRSRLSTQTASPWQRSRDSTRCWEEKTDRVDALDRENAELRALLTEFADRLEHLERHQQ